MLQSPTFADRSGWADRVAVGFVGEEDLFDSPASFGAGGPAKRKDFDEIEDDEAVGSKRNKLEVL